MKSVIINIGYDNQKTIGRANIDKSTEELLATGEYILAPGYTKDEEGNRLVCLALIHEDHLLKESQR